MGEGGPGIGLPADRKPEGVKVCSAGEHPRIKSIQVQGQGPAPDILVNKGERTIPANKDENSPRRCAPHPSGGGQISLPLEGGGTSEVSDGRSRPPYPKTRPSGAVVFWRGRFAGICEHSRLRGCEPFRQIRTKFWRGRFGRIIQVSALGSAPDILPNKDERAIPANSDEVPPAGEMPSPEGKVASGVSRKPDDG